MENYGKIIKLGELRELTDCTETVKELENYENNIGYKRECSKTQKKA